MQSDHRKDEYSAGVSLSMYRFAGVVQESYDASSSKTGRPSMSASRQALTQE